MELLRVLFITFFFTTIFLLIQQRRLLQGIKEIKKDYFNLCEI